MNMDGNQNLIIPILLNDPFFYHNSFSTIKGVVHFKNNFC